MTEMSTGEQLYQGILSGQVPRQVRLFAAQGLLPVSREDLLKLQAVLSADPDEELAEAASTALRQEEPETLAEWIQDHDLEPLILDLLTRIREEEVLWSAVATHANVSDETLRVLARHGSPLIQDIVITNQVRILGCLEILEDLKVNTQVTQVILRRVREFEEEFIEKAIAGAEKALEAEREGPSIEEALDALRAIGAHIPRESTMPYPRYEDPALEKEVEQAGLSTYGRILRMSIKEKVVCALKGTREERTILINSRNRLVVRAVMASPKLSDPEVERFAQSRSISDEVIRIIAANRRWMRLYSVMHAVVQNPKTPLQTALRMLPQLNHRDLGRVATNRNVNPVVRRRAKEFHARRR